MVLELENKFAVIDLRTPKNVRDFVTETFHNKMCW